MDYQNREFIRQQLVKCGFKDLNDELLDGFIESLKDGGDLLSTSKGNTSPERPSTISQSSTSNRNRYQTRLNQGSNKYSATSTLHEQEEDLIEEEEEVDDDDEEEEIEEPLPRRTQLKSTRNSINTQKKNSNKNSISSKYDDDEEISNWSKRLKSIQSKAQNLDNQISECRKAIVDDQVDDEKDVPLYFGTSERKLDPYPTVKKKMSGGFIRPPPVRSSRKTGPKGRKLLYEERNPEYIPPPERRRDGLRWQIRQKLIYSDPKYH